MVRSAFPDLHYTIVQVIGEGETLAYRLSAEGTHQGTYGGIEPTGKNIKWTQWFFSEFKDGKIVTAVGLADNWNFYQQMGATPPSAPAGS